MKNYIVYISLFLSCLGSSQETISELLKAYNTESVPYIFAEELAMPKTEAILLDAREPKEYEISHLKDAINVGYDLFNIETLTEKIPDKSAKIIVYCSLGVRSEDVAEQLKNKGYTNVYNLFGGIFEWKNKNFDVYNAEGKTEDVHAFSKDWSQWLLKGNKRYD